MNRIKLIGAVIVFVVFLAMECKSPNVGNQMLILTNKSDSRVMGYIALGGEAYSIYPDTILPKEQQGSEIVIKDYDKFNVNGWKDAYFDQREKLLVFFISMDTLEKYSWSEIRIKNKILARYDLTFENIKKLGGVVPYPSNDTTINCYKP